LDSEATRRMASEENMETVLNPINDSPASAEVATDVRKEPSSDEQFEQENGYNWDYVIIFRVIPEDEEVDTYQKENAMRVILQKIHTSGLEFKLYYSAQKDEVYCKIRAPMDRLKEEADRINYKLKLNAETLRRMAEQSTSELSEHYEKEHNIKPIVLEDLKGVSQKAPFEDIYGKYDQAPILQDLYQTYQEGSKGLPGTIFRSVDRLKLMVGIMEAPSSVGGCNMELTKLQKGKALLAAFPLHQKEQKEALSVEWQSWWYLPNNQPYDKVKDYFGEKIALYFAWLGYYTTWLIIPAVFGFICQIDVWSEGTVDAHGVPYFGVIMMLWGTFYLEYWKRRNATLAQQWGMTGFEEEEQTRPDFEGEDIKSPITGKLEKYFNPKKAFEKIMYSIVCVGSLSFLVLGVVVGIYWFKYWSTSPEQDNGFLKTNGAMIASLMNAMQIQILNQIFQGVAEYLTDNENHRTDTKHEDALISKVFIFTFVNSFGSCFYLAFVKPHIVKCRPEDIADGTCTIPNPMKELSGALTTIFLLQLLVGNFQEIAVPYVKSRVKHYLETKGSNKSEEDGSNSEAVVLSDAENEYFLEEYEQMGTFKDYSEMVLQMGYGTLFVTSFPLAPALAFCNNIVEIRIDGYKLLTQTRRAEPRGAEDIGTWYTILEIMGVAAVITNALVICFASERTWTQGRTAYEKLALFVIFEHLMLSLKYFLSLVVEDVPREVDIQLSRQDYLVRKIILLEPDEDEDEIQKKADELKINILTSDRRTTVADEMEAKAKI